MNQPSAITFRWPLFGNEHVRSYFETAVRNDTLSHCYLFSGPAGVGKKTYAETVAQMALCRTQAGAGGTMPCGACASCRQVQAGTHPDVLMVRVAEGKQRISVEAIRDFISQLETGTFGAALKIGIIESAEALTAEAANALLKTLEEPVGRRLIILTAGHYEQVPATVASRAQLIRFRPVPHETVYDYLVHERGTTRDFAKTAADLAFGRPAWAVRLAEDDERMKQWLALLSAFRAATRAPRAGRLSEVARALEANEVPADALIAWQAAVRERLHESLGIIETEAAVPAAPREARALAEAAGQAHAAGRYLQANVSLRSVLDHLALQLST